MSWAEFLIRSHAYKRKELRHWQKVRKIAYAAIVGSHQDPKKLPKTETAYMPLEHSETVKKGVTDSQKETFLTAYNNYLKQKNG